jgi:hypothetical protein
MTKDVTEYYTNQPTTTILASPIFFIISGKRGTRKREWPQRKSDASPRQHRTVVVSAPTAS